MFDAINRLWHKMCGKLHHPVETKHRSHQCHEEKIVQRCQIAVSWQPIDITISTN